MKQSIEQLKSNATITQAWKELASYQRKAVQAKATCARSVFKHLLLVSCLAVDANYQKSVTGTSSAPIVKVKKAACATFQTACKGYFASANLFNGFSAYALTCADPTAKRVTELLKGSYSDAVNTELTNLLKNAFSSTATTSPTKKFKGTRCSAETSTASDCDFICTNVITATGFKANAFHLLDTTSNDRRVLATSQMSLEDDGVDITTATPDDGLTVVAEESVTLESSSTSSGKFASHLVQSLVGLLVLLAVIYH